MNHTLIQNWNSVVTNQDLVFHLGDFAFADRSKFRQIANSLNGTKILIQGNHDRTDDIPTECFTTIVDMFQVSIWDSELNEYATFIMSHYPLATWAGINRGIFNLHGHIHSTPDLSGTGFDIVVANINRNILLADMPMYVNKMNQGAILLLSGFYVQDADKLITKAESLGLKLVGKSELSTWCMLKFTN